MVDFRLKRGCCLLLLLLAAQLLLAQSVQVEGARRFRKASADSVYLRPSVVKKQQKEAERKLKSASKEVKPRVKKSAVDSVRFTPRRYALGERVIMPGDTGHDVKSVAKILVKKLYIDEAELKYTADGAVVYDAAMQRAVKHFQEFNGFYADGIIGQSVIKALRRKK